MGHLTVGIETRHRALNLKYAQSALGVHARLESGLRDARDRM